MPTDLEGPYTLPGVDLETWLIQFDKRGKCESPRTRAALLKRIASEPDLPIILFSHGWNNEFGVATNRYASFLRHLKLHLDAGGRSRLPLFVGVIWPSTWLSFDDGPDAAGAESHAAATSEEEALKQDLARTLPDGAKRDRLRALLGTPRLTEAQAKELSQLLTVALAMGMSGGGTEGAEAAAPDAESLVLALRDLQQLSPSPTATADQLEGPAITPGDQVEARAAGILGFLDPRWALRIASVYQMKDRAGTVGSNGVWLLVRDILALGEPSPGLHLVGHSFGAKVVLSAIAANPFLGKVKSVLLLQPAISHLCFAASIAKLKRKGGYHHVLERVQQPILITYSAHDVALHEIYHRALRRKVDLGEIRIAAAATSAGSPPSIYAALGGYGPRGIGELLIEPMPAPGQMLDIPAGKRIVGLDGTIDRAISTHRDVTTPQTAWLLYLQLSR
jgi:hypothetical protein